MPSLIVDDAPVNGVDAAATANNVKVNGVHTEEERRRPEEDEPEEDEPEKEDESEKEGEPKKDDESEEDKEIKARKKALDALNAQYKDFPPGSKPELVHLDKRWDKNGDEYYVQQKKAEPRIPGGDWWEKHVLVVVRHFEQYDPEEIEKSTVEVYSAYLRKTLAKVIPTYPSISFQTEQISLSLPVECLYHYFSELRADDIVTGHIE
ncbi:hypothetical protein B0H14DRAFT_3128589 [Mycena olivaceomarginata]|nr:hypothetical protein B0H14DRAFT_3128589 [Mycena olivaceomarginata]